MVYSVPPSYNPAIQSFIAHKVVSMRPKGHSTLLLHKWVVAIQRIKCNACEKYLSRP
jgi:hypothetical protein